MKVNRQQLEWTAGRVQGKAYTSRWSDLFLLKFGKELHCGFFRWQHHNSFSFLPPFHKKAKTPLPLLKTLKQKQGIGGKSKLLSMTSPPSQHTTSPKMWANYLSHQSSPTPGHSPALPIPFYFLPSVAVSEYRLWEHDSCQRAEAWLWSAQTTMSIQLGRGIRADPASQG